MSHSVAAQGDFLVASDSTVLENGLPGGSDVSIDRW